MDDLSLSEKPVYSTGVPRQYALKTLVEIPCEEMAKPDQGNIPTSKNLIFFCGATFWALREEANLAVYDKPP